jgi:bacillopeptidase F
VAPDAQWIAVKIYNDAGEVALSDIHLGFQWLLDPDDNPATDDAPDVVNNCWGFRQLVDQCYSEFQLYVQALKAAEIAVVFSAGNEGPGPSTSLSPGNYPQSFTVGGVDAAISIASFSSRGPSACDGGIYPHVVGPGVNVKAADLTYGGVFLGSYTYVSGTSIAAPHVAGAMALLIGGNPELPVSDFESALQQTARDLGEPGADNDYGYGLIDVAAAEEWLAGLTPICTDGDGDGYFAEAGCGTGVDCVDSDPGINPGACDIKADRIDQDCDGKDRTRGKPCPGSSDPVDTGDTGGAEGKGKTCSDGLDNDGDGLTDYADPDCSRNKGCK